MKLGIGAKAGLTAGIILYVYTTILGILLLVWEPLPLTFRLQLFLDYYHFVIIYFFHLDGGFFEQEIINEIIGEFSFLIWLIFITLVLGIGYALYDHMPIRSAIVKGLTYGILAWWVVTGAILYLLYPIGGIFIVLFEIPAWLSYGFLLGKLYEVIPKEAKVGISVIKIKKLLFFIFLILAVDHLILLLLLPSPLRAPIHRLVLLIFRL